MQMISPIPVLTGRGGGEADLVKKLNAVLFPLPWNGPRASWESERVTEGFW